LLSLLLFLFTQPLWSQSPPQSGVNINPLFIADLPNPNDFGLFANGGWDGNWYIGYHTCWVQKLTVPDGSYKRAFIGVKLGRMKNYQPPGKAPWEKKSDEGEIYMAISGTASWSRAQSFLVTGTG